ncbi:hypothetical protein K2173_019728 [Erythroxylum novogranatense]|uniref:Two-component response regulator-like APRR1 n=1 Tax=Erythroxylum novogranatense TaxID=1862640 RepID=A0AAV8SMY9_9ROSI|nr:hypothetical protein K2173_019728 [Erythroxylum novogranatense]
MEGKEINLNKETGPSNGISGDGFIDRSKVRILLCDNDSKSSEEVFTLLLNCSYQVTSVRSARQVIDVLNAEGTDIDIILAEVDLPMKKGMKMLKYIARDKELRRIPVIMMSVQDEVSIVVKCLRLGAADYLVKPLRTNELLNLWTHMWRRRRMLGLVEKNILNCDFDVVVSDPSDANTNSTTLFSDDTDDKSRRSTNPEMGMSAHQGDESAGVAVELSPSDAQECRPDVPGISDHRAGHCGPRKSELNNGESSAFFTYVKSSTTKNNSLVAAPKDDKASQSLKLEDKIHLCGQPVINDAQLHENGEAWDNYSQDDFRSSSSIPDSLSLERSCTPPLSREFPQRIFNEENPSQVLIHPGNEAPTAASGLSTQNVYPYYMSGVMNQVIVPQSAQLFPKNLQELQNHAPSVMLPQYNHLQHCTSQMNGMASFPYYPVSICLQPGQMSGTPTWTSVGSTSAADTKLSKVDRREAALIKFRQKRKERCFDKKIRYVNRKKLAERRPRVRGQFVRKLNGVNVDLNGQPTHTDYEDDEEGDEDELALKDSAHEEDPSGL